MKLTPFLRYWHRRLGWQRCLGIILMLTAAGLYQYVVKPQIAQLTEWTLSQQHQHARITEQEQQRLAATPQAAAQRFYATLPAQAIVPDALKTLYDAAEETHLELAQVTYQLSHEPDAHYVRYKISVPVTGSYPDIRHFIKSVLDTLPYAALETVTLGRDDPHDQAISANLLLVLYLKAHP